jgi:hypothetical protein
MRRVHVSTAVACSVVLAILVFLNYVGERDDSLCAIKGEHVCFHGWPLTYLTRRPDVTIPTGGGFFNVTTCDLACGGAFFSVASGGFACGAWGGSPLNLSIWTPTRNVADFSGKSLLLDLLISMAIVAATGYLCQRRIRRRGGLLRMGMKELLSIVTLVAIGCACISRQWHEGTRQSAVLAKMDEELCSVGLVQTLPDWLVELFGAERLQPFERAASATLGDFGANWSVPDEHFDQSAVVDRLSRQVTALRELDALEHLLLWKPPPNEAFLRKLGALSQLEVVEVGSQIGAVLSLSDTAGESFEARVQLHLEDLYFPDWRRDFVSNLLILETIREVLPDVKVVVN